jgi:gluconokinase
MATGDDTPVVLGVDIGTTSTKVVAFDAAGAPRARAELGYPLLESGQGRAEQDPTAILAAVVSTVREAAAAPARRSRACRSARRCTRCSRSASRASR